MSTWRRQAHAFSRWVLLWFALFLGVSAAAPALGSSQGVWVCTTTGVKFVVPDSRDSNPATLDCPLCLPGMALPPSHAGAACAYLASTKAPILFLAASPTEAVGAAYLARAPPQKF